jgi:hypothetical protein
MTPIFRTLYRCLVCGSSEVRTDEVVNNGLVHLSECARCSHRWTRREPQPRRFARTRGTRGLASAA